jgi:hypothetical protein
MPKLNERIEYLQGFFRRDIEKYSKLEATPTTRGYVVALATVIPMVSRITNRKTVDGVLDELSKQIELALKDCDYEIETPDREEEYNRAIHTMYKRAWHTIENLRHQLPKES